MDSIPGMNIGRAEADSWCILVMIEASISWNGAVRDGSFGLGAINALLIVCKTHNIRWATDAAVRDGLGLGPMTALDIIVDELVYRVSQRVGLVEVLNESHVDWLIGLPSASK